MKLHVSDKRLDKVTEQKQHKAATKHREGKSLKLWQPGGRLAKQRTQFLPVCPGSGVLSPANQLLPLRGSGTHESINPAGQVSSFLITFSSLRKIKSTDCEEVKLQLIYQILGAF